MEEAGEFLFLLEKIIKLQTIFTVGNIGLELTVHIICGFISIGIAEPDLHFKIVRQFLENIYVEHIAVRLNAGFRILPGTGLFDIAREEGIVKDESELLAPKFYFSRDTEPEWLYSQIKSYYKRNGYKQIRTPWLFFVRRRFRLWFGRGR